MQATARRRRSTLLHTRAAFLPTQVHAAAAAAAGARPCRSTTTTAKRTCGRGAKNACKTLRLDWETCQTGPTFTRNCSSGQMVEHDFPVDGTVPGGTWIMPGSRRTGLGTGEVFAVAAAAAGRARVGLRTTMFSCRHARFKLSSSLAAAQARGLLLLLESREMLANEQTERFSSSRASRISAFCSPRNRVLGKTEAAASQNLCFIRTGAA